MKYLLLFFDHNEKNIEQYKELTFASDKIHLRYDSGDVKDVMRRHSPHIIVSPANCYGSMDGGIDSIYMQMFPEIESRVQQRIAQLGVKTSSGRKVLPIGSAILVPTGPCGNAIAGEIHTKLIACVPTMFTPQLITKTPTNVYWAMRGLLKLLMLMDRNCALEESSGESEYIVACPCFGTGVGGLSIDESVRQVQAAMFDHAAGDKSLCDAKCDVRVCCEPKSWAYVLSNHANKRPDE